MDALIDALRNPAAYRHCVHQVKVVETHISWVLLTVRYAYKIKKPLNLGFLDFSTLERRRHFCQEEVRLNRRFAPHLYLGTVPITGTPDTPRVNGDGPAIEYAVQMRQFREDARLDRMLARDALNGDDIMALGQLIGEFHLSAPITRDPHYASPDAVYAPVAQNFAQICPLLPDQTSELGALASWSEQAFRDLYDVFRARQEGGWIREGHGDLHLGNIALVEGRITPFDCIEFNPALRWIDVMSEVAFLTMDLEDRGRPDFARLALSAYLEVTGDYDGLKILPFYQAYRAMVRAKIAAIRGSQKDVTAEERRRCLTEYDDYVALARQLAQPRERRLIITHGVSGSGKSTVARYVLETLPAVRVRSDVERKRLFELPATARTGATLEGGIYAAAATTATYERLAAIAKTAIQAGFSVVVDAAFLKAEQRSLFRNLANQLRVPFQILACEAEEARLRQRIRRRLDENQDASDADLAVLDHQRRTLDPFSVDELPFVVPIDTGIEDLATQVRTRLTG